MIREGDKVKHKLTGEEFEVVPYDEPIEQGFALGLGEDAKADGIVVKDKENKYLYIPKRRTEVLLSKVE